MVRYESFLSKWSVVLIICITLLGGFVFASTYSLNRQIGSKARQPNVVPTAGVIAYAELATLEPTRTPTREPSETSSPTATATQTASVTPVPPKPRDTPLVVATKVVQALPLTADPDILPNGVRYGDHTPRLPHRVVRIASPDIKLDTRVYEVYGTLAGTWEVADYAAGHQYTSKNPGEGGNIVLSGHNNWHGEVFRYLEFLKPGDTINLWTLEGKEYTYKVQTIEKLKEAGVSRAQRLEHGKVMDDAPTEQLTLITCWPYATYTHRLIVIAEPVE